MFLWGIFRVSSKLMATAVLSAVLFIFSAVAMPETLRVLIRWAKGLEDWFYPIGSDLQGTAGVLYENAVDDKFFLGILLTLIARIFVELIWGLFSMIFGGDKGEKDFSPIGNGDYFD